MKFLSVLALCAIAFTAVSAAPAETNARRMAEGLPPMKPRALYEREDNFRFQPRPSFHPFH
ncbi:hypothetical protein ARMGADRAFT_1072654 [Armillaria gallica]|uniref:Uncharacterized protein n=1 Tax=Armillaria gallica TaxID=47427 RepID=A0A2H3EMP6_ARMGA|nr:hypothetical protein ARMGADRAFT_1072654 [Armillaria gallica]